MFTEWRDLLPLYAAAEVEIPVKVYEPKREQKQKQARTHVKPARMQAEEKAARFWRKNKITVFGAVFLMLWTVVTCCVTGSVVRKRTTAEVTSELRAGFSDYLAQQDYERSAAAFLTGEDSLQTAMDAEADSLARLLYGYRNNSLRDRKTLIWCVLARVDNNGYPGSVEAVVNQDKQWMFYTSDNPIREDDRAIALEQLREWHSGKYPEKFDDSFVYAEWSASDIALRNTWLKSSDTSWWRFPE